MTDSTIDLLGQLAEEIKRIELLAGSMPDQERRAYIVQLAGLFRAALDSLTDDERLLVGAMPWWVEWRAGSDLS